MEYPCQTPFQIGKVDNGMPLIHDYLHFQEQDANHLYPLPSQMFPFQTKNLKKSWYMLLQNQV
jgi:UV DNA damage repair endonuclease